MSLYYSPEKHGLTKVAEVDLAEPCWSFDILAVWADKDGFHLGTDSGCSCPSPFENYGSRDDLTGPLTREQALEEAASIRGGSTYDPDAWKEFLGEVRAYTA